MTAVTRAGTLSRVMISCGGTSMVTVLKSILTILSTNGRRIKSPGPLGPPCTRPRRKITPRSYSLTILIALVRMDKTITTTATNTMADTPRVSACNKPKIIDIREAPFALARKVGILTVEGLLDGHHLDHLRWPGLATYL